jgi:hypothetical protein
LSPLNKSEENNNDYECVLTGALEVSSIKHLVDSNTDKKHFDGDLFLYMDHVLATAYILSYDFKKIVWFYELDSNEEIFKYFINNHYMYILSFENFKKSTIFIRKVSLLDKKTDWIKKIQLDSEVQYSLKSENANEIGISFQANKKDNSFHLLYTINYSGEITTSNSVTDLIDNSQLKTLSDFIKNKK